MASPQDRALTYSLSLGFILIALFAVSIYWKGRPQRQQAIQERRSADALVQSVLQSAPVTGADEAAVLLVDFGDFQCPTCKQASAIVQEALAKRPGIARHAWIHAYNSENHPAAEGAAIASQCAHQQGLFWPFHDLLFQEQDKLSPLLYNQIAQTLKLDKTAFQACLSDTKIRDRVRAHAQFASRQGITEVPYLLINDQPVAYPFTAGDLIKLIDQASS